MCVSLSSEERAHPCVWVGDSVKPFIVDRRLLWLCPFSAFPSFGCCAIRGFVLVGCRGQTPVHNPTYIGGGGFPQQKPLFFRSSWFSRCSMCLKTPSRHHLKIRPWSSTISVCMCVCVSCQVLHSSVNTKMMTGISLVFFRVQAHSHCGGFPFFRVPVASRCHFLHLSATAPRTGSRMHMTRHNKTRHSTRRHKKYDYNADLS